MMKVVPLQAITLKQNSRGKKKKRILKLTHPTIITDAGNSFRSGRNTAKYKTDRLAS